MSKAVEQALQAAVDRSTHTLTFENKYLSLPLPRLAMVDPDLEFA
jgi:hypothetical protein